ncbi:MAG: ATP-binding cassette domain-containing protein [Chloroflexi bacterium]|nr:ATP-binding cassette domain-containing protein [Chloroflexota bacterium]
MKKKSGELHVAGVCKSYDGVDAVSELDFRVYRGEVFGLLGPNGAGKTTTIRMIMDIIKPDAGEIVVLGDAPGVARDRVGYLPEERGLYRNLPVLDTLVYLAELKGQPRATARRRANALLAEVELADWAHRPVKALSRGMQQKVQLIASLVHDPALLILDEPFQGLDPLNVELVKSLIRKLQDEGKTIVLSTHQMNLVEALCDRILLIHRGRAVLYGPLREIKEQYAPGRVRLRTSGEIDSLPGVQKIERDGNSYELTLKEGAPAQAVLQAIVERGLPVELFAVASAPLEEIFITAVEGEHHA